MVIENSFNTQEDITQIHISSIHRNGKGIIQSAIGLFLSFPIQLSGLKLKFPILVPSFATQQTGVYYDEIYRTAP